MSHILNEAQLHSLNYLSINPQDWTAIIPAAGRGSRLKSHLPKILYPILGKPMLAWLSSLLKPLCGNFVFIVPPDERSKVEAALCPLISTDKHILLTQEYPKGTADAILRAKDKIYTKHSLIIWGDQIGILPKTIKLCIQAHTTQSQYSLTFPTITKKHPYVHFVRNKDHTIINVKQTRNQELENIDIGENDFGLFLFNTQDLFKVLEQEANTFLRQKETSQEFDLLQIIPSFDRSPWKTLTLKTGSEEETLGINSIEDAQKMEIILKNR